MNIHRLGAAAAVVAVSVARLSCALAQVPIPKVPLSITDDDPEIPSPIVTVTGELTGILLVAVPLAFIISVALLAVYVRAVKRSMRRRAGVSVATPVDPSSRLPAAIPLAFADARAVPPSDEARRLLVSARRVRRGIALVYVVAGLATAGALTALYFKANGIEVLPLRTLYLATGYAWPTVMTLGLIAALSWRHWLALIGLYAAVMVAAVIPQFDEAFTPKLAILGWLIQTGPATLLTLIFLARRIRAVGPLTMAFCFAGISGVSIAVNAVGVVDARVDAVVGLGTWLGLDGNQTFFAVMATGAVLLGIVGWLLLRGLGWLYRTQRISDQTIMIDSLWLMFTVVFAIELAFSGVPWFFAGLGTFLLYKAVTLAGFAILRKFAEPAGVPPRLLLLRVFSLGKRSEQLFGAFAKLWRPVGGVHMIAGADLAASAVEPHEFLDFVAGRLSRSFIDGPQALERRIEESRSRRDPDGRYRVSEFFCHDDTWKMVLERLAGSSDAVMMDLRGFGPANKGCIFEIHALLDLVSLQRMLFIIDDTTDAQFLEETLQAGWNNLIVGSPNRPDRRPVVRLFKLQGPAEAQALLAAVAAAARPAVTQ